MEHYIYINSFSQYWDAKENELSSQTSQTHSHTYFLSMENQNFCFWTVYFGKYFRKSLRKFNNSYLLI